MPSLVSCLGDCVLGNSGISLSVDSFVNENAIVGLYFSSSSCPDRAFTPFLANFYAHIRKSLRDRKFDIVYVSGDKEKEAFDQYFGEMPWLAVPYDDLHTRSKLWKIFKVRVTPMLVLLDGSTGKLITANGRDCLSDDLEGKEFPWYPQSVSDIVNGQLLQRSELVDGRSVLQGKITGFYFSAHWCPPCLLFTPQLALTYEKLVADEKNFEIVFISSDRSESSFAEYYNSMPGWLAVPYRDQRCIQLTRHFGIDGIPCLVLVDENYQIISRNARFVVANDIEGKNFPWRRQAVEELSEANCAVLHEAAALIYFTDGQADLIETGKSLLHDVSSSYIDKWKASKETDEELPEIRFYYEGIESEEIADTLRSFAQLDSRKPLVAIFDPTEQRVFSVPDTTTDITSTSIDDLISEFIQAAHDFNPLLAMDGSEF